MVTSNPRSEIYRKGRNGCKSL